MPLKTEPMDEPGVNLTSMIDVVMLLIIFFMVGTRFSNPEHSYTVNLPTVAEAQPLTTLPDEVTVSVTAEGGFLWNGEPVPEEEILPRLKQAKADYEDQIVIVRGDALVPYQAVMTVLSACQEAKISTYKLANRMERKDQP